MRKYLRELHHYALYAAFKLGLARNYTGKAHALVLADITADAIRDSNEIAAAAHRAETYDLEAERLITAAQTPDSDGGEAITPREMRPIRALIHRSAETDHDIAEQTQVPA